MDDYSNNAASLLIEEIEAQKNHMIQVATGGSLIEEVDDKYRSHRLEIKRKLINLHIDEPNPADFRTAAMSFEAVVSVVNTLAIISGRRDK